MKNYKIIAYSPQNRYAQDYYTAFNNFMKVRNKLVKAQAHPESISDNQYKKLIRDFRRMDNNVSRNIFRANVAEHRLDIDARRHVAPKGVGEKLDIMG